MGIIRLSLFAGIFANGNALSFERHYRRSRHDVVRCGILITERSPREEKTTRTIFEIWISIFKYFPWKQSRNVKTLLLKVIDSSSPYRRRGIDDLQYNQQFGSGSHINCTMNWHVRVFLDYTYSTSLLRWPTLIRHYFQVRSTVINCNDQAAIWRVNEIFYFTHKLKLQRRHG